MVVVSYPVPLETVLRAKEAVLGAELKARRALKAAGVVFAVDAEALLLGGRFGSHGWYMGDAVRIE